MRFSYIAYRQDRDNATDDGWGGMTYPLIWTRRYVIDATSEPGPSLVNALLEDEGMPAGHYTFVPEHAMVDVRVSLDAEVTHVGGNRVTAPEGDER